MKHFTIALIISVVYFRVGNATAIAGVHHFSNEFLNSAFIEILFAPYTFIAGMSTFAGWDWLSCV